MKYLKLFEDYKSCDELIHFESINQKEEYTLEEVGDFMLLFLEDNKCDLIRSDNNISEYHFNNFDNLQECLDRLEKHQIENYIFLEPFSIILFYSKEIRWLYASSIYADEFMLTARNQYGLSRQKILWLFNHFSKKKYQ